MAWHKAHEWRIEIQARRNEPDPDDASDVEVGGVSELAFTANRGAPLPAEPHKMSLAAK